MDKTKEIFWEHFRVTGVSKTTFSILYDTATQEITKTDSTHTRIKKFNQLIIPQLLELDEREQELAREFLMGYLMAHISIHEIEKISDQLGTFIQRDLST